MYLTDGWVGIIIKNTKRIRRFEVEGFIPGWVAGSLMAAIVIAILVCPLVHSDGYACAIEDIKSYGADRVVARFDKEHRR